MICRNLYKLSRVTLRRSVGINRLKKFEQPSTIFINRRSFHRNQADTRNVNRYPDTDGLNGENNNPRDTNNNSSYKNDSSFNKNTQNIKENVKDSTRNIRDNVNEASENIKKNVKDNYRNTESNAKDAYENVKDKAKSKFENVKDNVNENYENVKDKTKSKFENAKENMNENYEQAKDKAKDSYNQYKEKPKNTYHNVKEGVQNATDKMKEKVDEAEEELEDTEDKMKNKYEKGKDNMKSKMKDVKEEAEDMGDKAKNKYEKTKDNVKSKMKDVKEEAEDMGDKAKDKYEKTKSNMKSKLNEKKEKAKSKMENVEDEAKSKKENAEDETKSKMENLKEEAKDKFENIKNKFHGNLDMNTMLQQARMNFENLLKMEDGATKDTFKDAKAIIFLSTVKTGLGISGVMGSGIMITRLEDNDKEEWSGPIAIGLTGVSVGLNAGYEKADSIIVVRDERTLKQISIQSQIQLSGNVAYAMGNTGHGSNYPLTPQKHKNTPMVVYSMAKGAYVSLSLDGEYLKIRNDINEEFYNKKVNVDDIITGKTKGPKNKDYNNLIKLLNNIGSTVSTSDSTINLTEKQKNTKTRI